MAVPSSGPRWRRGGIRMWLLWRDPAVGVSTPQTTSTSFAELRDAERYRDSLMPGSAEWQGAKAVVARARRAFERGNAAR